MLNRFMIILYFFVLPLGAIWEPRESFKMKGFKDIQLSPDHQTVVIVTSEAVMNDKEDQFISKLFISQRGQPLEEVISNHQPAQPRWSPDGKSIAFVAKQNNVQNLYLLPLAGGEPIQLTNGDNHVQTFRWSPDSRFITFVMSDELPKKKPKQIAIVYEEDTHVNRLWLVDVQNPFSIKPLTSDEYFVRGYSDWGTANEEFDWSPDGKKIVFAFTRGSGLDNMFMDSSIAMIDLASGRIQPWEKIVQYESQPFFSPDGKSIAYVISESRNNYFCNRYLAIRDADGTNMRQLAPTFNEGPLLAGPNLLGWSNDQQHLFFFEPYKTRYHLVKVPVDGSPSKEVETGEWFYKFPTLSRDRTKLGFIAQSPTIPPEAFVAQIDDFKPIQITHFNEAFKNKPLSKTEIITWKSTDGREIEGLLTYPLDYIPGRRYPLLVNVHGGPMFFFDETFNGAFSHLYSHAAFGEAGIATLRPNPRGSTGYGKEFRQANYNDWCGKDYEDVISGLDYVIAKGIADPDKVGICGWSYGGYMSAWAVTQTHRFKAASIGAALTNMTSFAGTTDLHRFIPEYFGNFFQSLNKYPMHSPLHYAENVETPCLIQHGINDLRVPVSQAYELYHALNRRHKIATLEIYPGMEHGPAKPKMLLELMERNFEWFKEHL